MRVIAVITVHNEERVIRTCLDSYARQGVEVMLMDNDSTDRTVAIARNWLGRGLIGIERLPRDGSFSLTRQLAAKQAMFERLEADWFINADADEIRLPPPGYPDLPAALAAAEAAGCNAVDFVEYVFIPTAHHPEHDPASYVETMRWYYPFQAWDDENHIKAWRRQPGVAVDLVSTGGHLAQFPGRRVFPEKFIMKHYPFLGLAHGQAKYGTRQFDPDEMAQGWHRQRARLRQTGVRLPDESEMRAFQGDDRLDALAPVRRHLFFPE